MATAARRVPAVVYITPFIMIGVARKLMSGPGPRLFPFQRHAISSSETLSGLIWSSAA